MGLFVILLSLMMLSSCTPSNLWQKAGIVSPEKIELVVKMTDSEESDGKLDVLSTIRGERDSFVSFSIPRPEGFEGKVLSCQTGKESEMMAESLGARCYAKEEMTAFLMSPIKDKECMDAVKNTASLVSGAKTEIIGIVTSFLPEISLGEDAGKEMKELSDYYNSFRDSANEVLAEKIGEIFDPLETILSSSHEPTWGDYVRCQLTINMLGGVLEAVEKTVDGIARTFPEEELMALDIDMADENDVKAFLEKAASSVVLSVITGTVSSVVSPLAVYNNIVSVYGEVLDLLPLTGLFTSLVGEIQ